MQVLVFTMGKVGSTTVMRACESAGIVAGRGYSGNIDLLNFDDYDAFVTMVRDPMARNISQFFELWSNEIDDVQKMYDFFVADFLHDEPDEWFQKWLEPVLGIDVYKGQFNRKQGWRVYDKDLLLIRTENLNDGLANGLANLLGNNPLDYTVEHRALGEEKFGPRYAEFLKLAKFDDELLDRVYETEYASYFYYKKEIKEFREQWSK